ncbi:MAG: hypothetical protein ACTSWY_01585 [Promethearchaeota archaeon]
MKRIGKKNKITRLKAMNSPINIDPKKYQKEIMYSVLKPNNAGINNKKIIITLILSSILKKYTIAS